MMMSALEAGGMPLLIDGIRESDVNNPKGYFELERAKKLPNGDTGWLNSAQGKAVKVISALLRYLPSDKQYRVIFMERDLDQILASQRKMLERLGKSDNGNVNEEEIRSSYQKHLAEVNSWLAEQPWIQTCYVSYNEVLQQPDAVFDRISDFLSHRVDPAAMIEVVDPLLYREQV